MQLDIIIWIKPETIKALNLKKVSADLDLTMEESFIMMLDSGDLPYEEKPEEFIKVVEKWFDEME